MWQSTIPIAIGALVQLFTDQVPGSGQTVRVTDGPFSGGDGTSQLVSVGWDGADDGIAVQAKMTSDGMGGDPNRETYTVLCCTSVVSGDQNSGQSAREQAFSLFGACCDALATDRTLGGVVLRAMPDEVTVRQSATPTGWACTVLFGVSVSAFTTD